MGKLLIEFYSEDFIKRPQVSFKIREYITEYIEDKLFKPYNIILSSKYDYNLGIIFSTVLSNTERDLEYLLSKPTIYKKELVKSYTIYLTYDTTKYDSTIDSFVELFLDVLVMFLKNTFKILKDYDFNQLYEDIDIAYLRSMPYPAPFDEQKFVNDHNLIVKKVSANYSNDTITYKEELINKKTSQN